MVTTTVDGDLPSGCPKIAFFTVDDARKPIIDRFGRYAHQNAIKGQMSTEQELQWIDKMDQSTETRPDIAKRMRKDVEARKKAHAGEPSYHCEWRQGDDLQRLKA